MKRMKSVCASLLAVAAATPAWAQESTPAAAPQASTPADTTAPTEADQATGDIVVTAQRREQTLQKVPIAVSAFNAQSLQQKQVRDTIDLIRFIPNLVGNTNVGLGSSNTYYIRGVGITESISTQDVPVGTYVDDVFISRQNANNFGLFDVERIEVLRGPQGTLFGRNTTGGAINVILRKPSDHVTGYLEGAYGSYDRREVRGSIDLPVSDKVLTKLSGYYRKDDGYVRQLSTGDRLNKLDGFGLRGAIRLLPTDNVTIDLSADYVDETDSNLNNFVRDGHRVTTLGIVKGALTPYFTGKKANNEPGNTTKNGSVTANVAVDAGPVTITSITGYRHLIQRYFIDSTLAAPNPVPYGVSPILDYGIHTQVSQEIKANGDALDGRLTYVAGLYYLYEDNDTDLGTGVGTATSFRVTGDRTLQNSLETYAAYAQGDYKLTEALTATAGLRWTHEDKDLHVFTNPGAKGGSSFSNAGIVAAGIPTQLRESFVTPRFALSYQIDPDVMVYASATRGEKSGGWNGRALANNLFFAFDPEKVWSEEIGLRSELFDRKVRFNLTGFYAYTKDVQISAAYFAPNGDRVVTTTNPAGLRNYGVEAELEAAPIRNLNIGVGAGLQHARYANVSDAVQQQIDQCRAALATGNAGAITVNCNRGFVDFKGRIARPVRTPTLTLTSSASYRLETRPVAITPAANLSYTTKYAIGNAGSPDSTDGSFTRAQTFVDASVMFEPAGLRGVSLSVDCKNCFNKAYNVSFLSPTAIYINPPRTWSVRAAYRF